MPTHSADSPNTPRIRRAPIAPPTGAPPASAPPNGTAPRSTSVREPGASLAGAPRASAVSTWALLPLRLFLGITFVYAGLQKLTDPQYFRPSAPGFIGKQISGFATGSPIGGLLLHVVVPHAAFFGALVAYGELAIGLGTLVGLLVRPAAFFGALISLLFFLSASWRVQPYFYGSDIVFLFGWVTLVIAGPLAGGWPAFDAVLVRRLLPRVPVRYRVSVAHALAVVLGTDGDMLDAGAEEAEAHGDIRGAGAQARTPAARQAQALQRGRGGHAGRSARGRGRSNTTTRRDFIRGTLTGAASAVGLLFVVSLFRRGDETGTGTLPSDTSGAGATSTSATPGATSAGGAAGSGNTIAQVSAVPANSAAQFTIPSNGDPGVLVHLNNGQFVAFDATCTHAGCPVQYDPGSQLLICPCHGAEFDPAHAATVVQGPAGTPLANVPIHVDNTSGNITVA